MKNWQMLSIVAGLMIAAGAGVFFLGIQPKPIQKISLSVFENSDVVVNSLFLSIPADIESAQIFFLGIDPADREDGFAKEVFSKFWSKAQGSERPFQAVVMDQNIDPLPQMQAEHFDFKKEPERFLQGLKAAEAKGVRLLVVASQVEASMKFLNSYFSIARKTVYLQNPEKIAGLVVTKFPRQRSDEAYATIPCNTGEEDRGQTADLGCYILQKSRFLYRKKLKPGAHVGLLDQLGLKEFVLLLGQEPQK